MSATRAERSGRPAVTRALPAGSRASGADATRQAANVLAALAQASVPFVLRGDPPRKGGESPLIVPASGTFAIWAPIFALSLGSAGFQAWPTERTRPLLRRVGWLTAAAFASTGTWAPLVRLQRWRLAQGALVMLAAIASVARRRVAVSERETGLEPGERWLVAAPVALLSAWGTAASAINLAAMINESGAVRHGAPERALAAGTFLSLGALASAELRVDGAIKTFSSRTYGATVLWALAGAAVNQRTRSKTVTAATATAALLVIGALGPGRDHRRPER